MPRNIASEWYLASEDSIATPLGTSPTTLSSLGRLSPSGRLGAPGRLFGRITECLHHLWRASCLVGGLIVGLFSAEAAPAPELSPSVVAKAILDETKPAPEREALINTHTNVAAALIAEMTRGVKPGEPEEYQRIPWIWRVAIRAGKQNEPETIRRILEVSLPQGEEDLRDWQAVVIGGGLINGLSQLQVWPGDRLTEIVAPDAALGKRWQRALELASAMADDSSVPTGTRYDALRMLGVEPYEKRGAQLKGYLVRRANEELQMGAISGLADMRSPRVAPALLSGIGHYSEPNRNLALDALLRDEARQAALLEAVAAGRVPVSQLGEKRIQTLQEAANPELRARAAKLLTK